MRYSNTYIDGNTVRKRNYNNNQRIHQQRMKTLKIKQGIIQQIEYAERKKRLQNMGIQMSFWSALFMIMATCFTGVFTFRFVKSACDIDTQLHYIEQQKQELDRLKSENDALQNNLTTMFDTNDLYTYATEKLGMVHSGYENVIFYTKNNSNEYVRQYDEIPK